MFIVYVHWLSSGKNNFCVITETEAKAQEYIVKEMEGSTYNGTGLYKIEPICLYK